MPLKALVDSLDDVPETVKSFYRAGTESLAGKFVLDTEPVGGWALEDVAGLRNAFTTQKEELKAANSALEAFKGLGAASTVREKLGKLTRLEALDPEREADRLAEAKARIKIDELTAEHDATVKRAGARTEKLVGEITRLILDNEIAGAITKHRGAPELLTPHVASRVKVVERDGEFALQVTDENGRPAYRWRGSEAVDATVEDLVLDLKGNSAFARAFEASASGSGAKGGLNTGGGLSGETNPFSKKTFNLTEQSRLKKEDPAKFEHLKALAVRETTPVYNMTQHMRQIRAGSAA